MGTQYSKPELRPLLRAEGEDSTTNQSAVNNHSPSRTVRRRDSIIFEF